MADQPQAGILAIGVLSLQLTRHRRGLPLRLQNKNPLLKKGLFFINQTFLTQVMLIASKEIFCYNRNKLKCKLIYT